MASEHAIDFEAVLVSMSKTKDGTRIVLVIHPNDNANEIFSHPIGSRYRTAVVRLDDQDRPIPRTPQSGAIHHPMVSSAGMLCRNKDFQHWLLNRGRTLEASEEEAAAFVHRACGIKSRSELATNVKASRKFDALRDEFLRENMPV